MIRAPDIAENSAIVHIEIESKLPMSSSLANSLSRQAAVLAIWQAEAGDFAEAEKNVVESKRHFTRSARDEKQEGITRFIGMSSTLPSALEALRTLFIDRGFIAATGAATLYVVLTRATQRLLIPLSGHGKFASRLPALQI